MPIYGRLCGYPTESAARHSSRDLAIDIVEDLKTKGYTKFQPPPRLEVWEGPWDVFNNCRILIEFITGPPADEEFVLRVETFAE